MFVFRWTLGRSRGQVPVFEGVWRPPSCKAILLARQELAVGALDVVGIVEPGELGNPGRHELGRVVVVRLGPLVAASSNYWQLAS